MTGAEANLRYPQCQRHPPSPLRST